MVPCSNLTSHRPRIFVQTVVTLMRRGKGVPLYVASISMLQLKYAASCVISLNTQFNSL